MFPTSESDVNLNVDTFIGMSHLINYWYIFDQYKTIDILNATSKCVCVFRNVVDMLRSNVRIFRGPCAALETA